MYKKIPFFVLIAIFLTSFHATSMENMINITSNKLSVDMNNRKSTFTGNVYAHNNNLKIWSDEMTINLKINKDEIKEVLAIGNVKIIRLVEGSEIYGDVANYLIEEEVIIIKGDVTIKENGNQISGNELKVDLKNSSSIMEGSNSNRVEALIVDN